LSCPSKANVLVGMIAEEANDTLINPSKTEQQRSTNNFQSYTFNNQRAVFSTPAKVDVFIRIIANRANDTLVAPS